MLDKMLKPLYDFFIGNDAVQKVADDPALSAELLLLFRVMLADGAIVDAEMDRFRALCDKVFGIGPDDIEEVISYLNEAGYETTGRQALEVFVTLPIERRQELINHMIEIARADKEVHPDEVKLIKRASEILGLSV